MSKGRLEAFSDGVFAVLITILVLDLKVPHQAELSALREVLPTFLAYTLSFVFLGIYWNNHHHMLHAARKVTGRVLWANSHLLFWLSLVPFTTAWLGEHHLAQAPVAIYGVVLLGSAIAFTILFKSLLAAEGNDSELGRAIGRDWKGKVSIALYCLGIASSFASCALPIVCYVIVAALWFVPDTRIERRFAE